MHTKPANSAPADPARGPSGPSGPDSRRRVAVTGANRGIGLATAAALLELGADTVATYRHEHPVDPVATARHKHPVDPAGRARLTWLQADVTNDADLDTVAALELDGLVANAGLPYIGKVSRMPVEQARHYVQVNLTAAARLADSVARAMAERGGGTIVLVSSVAACYGILGGALYGGAKSGLVGCARALVRLHGAAGVRVHVVAPGYVETRVTADLAAHMREGLTQRHIPAQRFASAHEVGACLAHLVLGRPAPAVPGTTLIPLDGGFAMGWR